MNYYIQIPSVNKAKNDVDTIVAAMGFCSLTPRSRAGGSVARFLTKCFGLAYAAARLRRGDILFLQYPMKKFYRAACLVAHAHHARIVTLIHDLGAFRRHKLTPEGENRLLGLSDTLIVHNAAMSRYLRDHGYRGHIVLLDIFDYLSASAQRQRTTEEYPWRVAFAGGLSARRSGFLYALDDIRVTHWQMELYGRGLEENVLRNLRFANYRGFLPSDELITSVDADFGLVWDGDSTDACTGAWGEYLLINNPHKTSLYLRCGLPVLIWSKAAIAPFLLRQNCALVIDSLGDIDRVLSSLTRERYVILRNNAARVGGLITSGHFFRTAWAEAIRTLSIQ